MEVPPATPRRIRIASILTTFSAVAAILGVSAVFPWFQRELYEKLKVPMPGITLLFLSIPPALWWALALGVGGLLCLKDLWLREKTATALNHVAIPLLFLFTLLAQAASLLPLFSTYKQ